MLRIVLLAASALTTGFSVGRRAAAREVDRRKGDLIKTASVEARSRIKERAQSLVSSSSRAFLRRILVKALILSVIWFAYRMSAMEASAFRAIMAVAIGVLVFSDILNTWPTARLVAMEIKKHGLRPKRAISEMVAAQVFEEVLREIDNREDAQWHQRLLLGLAGRDLSVLSTEIAAAVAETARETSWKDVRPFLISAGLRVGILAVFYSAFASLMVFRATVAV